MTGHPSRDDRRLPYLDLLRFAAALAVTVYHFSARAQGFWGAPEATIFPQLNEFSRYGFFGVHLFFLISGFVILLSAEGKTVAQFAASRIARLYPAYWTALLITGTVLTLWTAAPVTFTGGQWLINLTMVQAAAGVASVDGVYWTLFVELRFYVAVAVLLACGLTRRRLLLCCAGWLALSGFDAMHSLGSTGAWLNLQWAPWFCAGIFLYALRDAAAKVPVVIGYVGCWLLACVQSVPAAQHTLRSFAGVDASLWPVLCIVTAIFVGVGLTCAIDLPAGRFAALFTTCGSLTYPLYLVHQYTGGLVISVLRHDVTPVTALVLTIAAMCGLAGAIHVGVERPLGPWLRRAVLRRLQAATISWPTTRGPVAPDRPAAGLVLFPRD